MFRKLNLLLKVDIYNEANFFVKKTDETHYVVGSTNGLRAFVTFDRRVMFVKVLDTDDSVISRYCTPMNDVDISYADFVIMEAKKTIYLHINKKSIESFELFAFNIFMKKKALEGVHIHHQEPVISKDSCLYDNLYYHFEDIDYKKVEFIKKKVIKNIYKFQFTQHCKKHSYYMLDKRLIEVSNYQSYFTQVNNTRKNKKTTVNTLLVDAADKFKQHINLSQIPLLKIDDEFCVFERKQNLNIHYVNQSKITSLGYISGKLEFGEVRADSFAITKYHLTLLQVIETNFKKLCLSKPSEHIIKALTELDLPVSLPLSEDDLIVLDMYKI